VVQVSLAFTGYAAVWDRRDRAGDVFRRGAFGGARLVPLLWQHRGAAVGEAVAREDERGLRVEGRVHDARAAALVRAGAVAGLSVGFRTLESRQAASRLIARAVLAEVSLVAVPMQPLARIDEFHEGEKA